MVFSGDRTVINNSNKKQIMTMCNGFHVEKCAQYDQKHTHTLTWADHSFDERIICVYVMCENVYNRSLCRTNDDE